RNAHRPRMARGEGSRMFCSMPKRLLLQCLAVAALGAVSTASSANPPSDLVTDAAKSHRIGSGIGAVKAVCSVKNSGPSPVTGILSARLTMKRADLQGERSTDTSTVGAVTLAPGASMDFPMDATNALQGYIPVLSLDELTLTCTANAAHLVP